MVLASTTTLRADMTTVRLECTPFVVGRLLTPPSWARDAELRPTCGRRGPQCHPQRMPRSRPRPRRPRWPAQQPRARFQTGARAPGHALGRDQQPQHTDHDRLPRPRLTCQEHQEQARVRQPQERAPGWQG